MNPVPVEPAILACETRGLRKSFGTTRAVDGLDLRVPRGLLYAFLGPNGAGKTTSIRMIAGLLRPDSGEVFIEGVPLRENPSAAKRPLAYVPDDPILYGKLRPLEYLEFVSSLWDLPTATTQPRAEELLQTLGLWEKRDDYIETFSRGMKQKMALCGALVHAPSLMLLDEPLTGLDAASARLVKDLLLDFVRRGHTVILTTHILDVAERLAERIGILHAGRLAAEGTLDQLRHHAGESGSTLEDIFLRVTQEGPSPLPPSLPPALPVP
jgi:ABC-2 type transport system ATP-binding protein